MDDQDYYDYLQHQRLCAQRKLKNHQIGFRRLEDVELQKTKYWLKAMENALLLAQHREDQKKEALLTLCEGEMAKGQMRPSLYKAIKTILEGEK